MIAIKSHLGVSAIDSLTASSSNSFLLEQHEHYLHDGEHCSPPSYEAYRDQHPLRPGEGVTRTGRCAPCPFVILVHGRHDQGSPHAVVYGF
jgi:hypothetical protein